MSENTVYTLAKTLQKTDGLEKDFAQMLSALRDTVENENPLCRQCRNGICQGASPEGGHIAARAFRLYG